MMFARELVPDKYTVSIHNMLARGIMIFDFHYPLNENYKKQFEECFIQYYMYSEIGFYMPAEFIQRLKSRLLMLSEYYNTLFEITEQKYNPLINKQLQVIGLSETKKINSRDFESVRHELNDLWNELKALRDQKYKQNIEEAGETTDDKKSHQTEELKKSVDTGEDYKENVEGKLTETSKTDRVRKEGVEEHVTQTVETTSESDKRVGFDSTEGVVGKSSKDTEFSETSDSYTMDKRSDTPQGNLSAMSDAVLSTKYLTSLNDSKTDTSKKGVAGEDITSSSDTTRHSSETTHETSLTDENLTKDTERTTNENETINFERKQDTTTDTTHRLDNTQETEQEIQTDYTHDIDGTHHFINDARHRMSNKESEDTRQHTEGSYTGRIHEQYHTRANDRNDQTIVGFENTSIPKLIVEWRGSLQNTIIKFVGEFEDLFMGVF